MLFIIMPWLDSKVASISNTAPEPELKEIIPVIKVITEPHQLGIQLEVPTHKLNEFEINYPKDVNRQMTEVIEYWRNNAGDCSWEALANAVDKMGQYGKLVIQLRDWHLKVKARYGISSIKACSCCE